MDNKKNLLIIRRLQRETFQGRKDLRIGVWKTRKVISDDWDATYEHYINTTNCEDCDIELVSGNKCNNRKCLDHCHTTGKVRAVICHKCNLRRGREDAIERITGHPYNPLQRF